MSFASYRAVFRALASLALTAAVLTLGWATAGRAVAAQASCSSLASGSACTGSEVGKVCAGTSDICTAYDCSDDGGATTVYRCTSSDAFFGSGCGCGVSPD